MSGKIDNLVSIGDQTTEKQREITSMGGVASGESKRRRKTLREWLENAMEQVMKKDGEPLRSPDTGEPLTRAEASMIKAMSKAANGDLKAIELVAKLLGEYQIGLKQDVSVTANVVVRSREEAYKYIYNDFSPTYQEFFYRNRDSHHVLLQGGRRSGKTQATIRHLLRLGAAMNTQQKVMVVCYQHPQLLKTIEDFEQITGLKVHADKAETQGLLWEFCNFDDNTKAQGSQCDYLFINEAVNLPEDVGDTLMYGVRAQVFYNFNPTKSSWVMKNVNADKSNLLCTTFKDNAYLTDEQIGEFEALRERATRRNSTMHDRYMYQVYYLGNFATMVGQVFSTLERCTAEDYTQVPAEEYFGLDFGFATDGDPTVLVGVKVYEKKVYCKQYVYEQGIVKMSDLADRFTECGLNTYCEISADHGGQGRGRMDELIAMGWTIRNAIKTERIDGLSQLLSLDAVVLVDGGDEMRAEFEGLEIKPPTATGRQDTRGADHAIDAVRYAFQASKYYG